MTFYALDRTSKLVELYFADRTICGVVKTESKQVMI